MKKIILLLCLLASRLNFLLAQCYPTTGEEFLDANNVRAVILNGGDLWWSSTHDDTTMYYVPKDSGFSELGVGALWFGGIDAGGNLQVAAQTYRQTGNDFFPGPLNQQGKATPQLCAQFDKLWKVNQSMIDSFLAGQYSYIPYKILDWPGRGNPNNEMPLLDLAPFVDANNDSIYNPVDGDYPKIKGDQAIWWVFNDRGNTKTETNSSTLFAEIQAMAYSFKSNDCLNNTTFYHYKITNKAPAFFWDINNFYVGFWSDPNSRCNVARNVGCDSGRNMAIAYPTEVLDGGSLDCSYYENNHPVIGLRMVQLPTDNAGDPVSMSSFIVYNNAYSVTGIPNGVAEYYWNYLRGYWLDDTPITYGGNGYGGSTPVSYMYPGDPADSNAWSKCALNSPPSESRFVMGFGPMTLYHGETREFTLGVIWDTIPETAFNTCPPDSFIQNTSDCVQELFNLNVIGINESEEEAYQFTIYPNPSSDLITISFAGNEFKQLQIINLIGETLITLSKLKGNQVTVPISSLPKGIYIVLMTDENGFATSRKIVVQ